MGPAQASAGACHPAIPCPVLDESSPDASFVNRYCALARASRMTPSSNLSQLHARYTLQAQWTASIRAHLFHAVGLANLDRILEVGSGTGVITAELSRRRSARVTGVDIDPEACAFASRQDQRTAFVVARGERLPFPGGRFHAALCHFLLLWTPDPRQILTEMIRVVEPGGAVLCLAEPDYGGRIDFPPELAELGTAQAESLTARGADVTIGRKLRALCRSVGLGKVQAGILGAEWTEASIGEAEWPTLNTDLDGYTQLSRLDELRALDAHAWERGERVMYVPTFYAWGRTSSDK